MVKKFRLYFELSVAFSFLPTISIFCIPLINMNSNVNERLMTFLIGAVFWGGIIIQQFFFWKSNLWRISIEKRLLRHHCQTYRNAPIGIISFFKNTEATVVDITLFAFALSVALLALLRFKVTWVIIGCVALLFLSFNLHCFLNGKNYRYIKSYSKYKKEQEKDE